MPRHRRWLFVALLPLCLLLTSSMAYPAENGRLTLGVLPTFDAGGAAFSDTFNRHLALKLFEEFEGGIAHPVLLNPGRLYSPADDEWLAEYGGKSGADALLITTLLKTDAPQKGDWTITVQSEILDLKSGKRSAPWKSAAAINKRDAQLDYRTLNMTLFGGPYIGPSRMFEKQPLGKAMKEIAEQIHAQALQRIEAMPATASQRNGRSGSSCDVPLKVLYVSKHTASKSYTIFVDGKEESLNLKDGELLLHDKTGTLLLQFVVNDAPYKLPRQEFYQASTDVDCAKGELSVHIGPAGEALLVWGKNKEQ
jgi:hypothetical protein